MRRSEFRKHPVTNSQVVSAAVALRDVSEENIQSLHQANENIAQVGRFQLQLS